jgi:hypothetical protein
MFVCQFDVPKKDEDDALTAAEAALLDLTKRCDIEGNELDDKPADDNKGWVDERDTLTAEELEELNESVRPMRLILVKVSC